MFAMDPREKSVICARLPPGRWDAMTWVERLVCLKSGGASATEFPPQPVEDGRWDPFSLWGLRDTMLQPLADAAPGDDEEKRALREQVAASSASAGAGH